jgi:predicted dehydrogenase
MLAKQLIDEGFVGRIFHWRGAYLQDWIVDPDFPLTWHLRREHAGAGPHFDLGSHNVDLARFLVGEIKSVSAMTAHFVTERPLPGAGAATFSAGSGGATETGPVTVEDAAFVTAEFENGALGSIDTSRFAPGRKNHHAFEIYGSDGSIVFDLERMNELQVFSRHDPAHVQGFRTVLATESDPPLRGRLVAARPRDRLRARLPPRRRRLRPRDHRRHRGASELRGRPARDAGARGRPEVGRERHRVEVEAV